MPSDDDADDGHEIEIEDSSHADDTQGEEAEEEL